MTTARRLRNKWRYLCAVTYPWRATWGNAIDMTLAIGFLIFVWSCQ